MSYESTAEPIKVGYLMDFKLPPGFPQEMLDDFTRCFDIVFEEAFEQGLMDRPVQMIYREVEGLPKGAVKAAQSALVQLHAETREFVLHLDTDVIVQEEFPSVNVPGSGGLSLEEVRSSLTELLKSKTLVGLDVAQYNPERDPGGSGAKKLVDLLVGTLSARLEDIAPAVQEVELPAAEAQADSSGDPA